MLSAGHSQARSAGATRVVALAALALGLLLAALAWLLPGHGTTEGAEPGTSAAEAAGEWSAERSAPLAPERAGSPAGSAPGVEVGSAATEAESTPTVPPGEIVGRVFDAKGTPLRAVQVRASLDPDDEQAHVGSGVSDREGWYRITRLPPGTYQLALRAAFESAGWTQLASVDVRSGETATVDLAYRGERTLRAAFEFASAWEEMDRSMQTVLLRRADRRGEVVARSFAFTRHAEPWCSGDVTFTGLEPGLYLLEAWPFVEEHQVWTQEVDLTLADVDLEPQALHSDRVWRPRARVPAPEKRSLR